VDKWSYKYSFTSGILFILSFFLKEIVLYSPKSSIIIIFVLPYIFMVLYFIGLVIGFLKYSLLNERIFLKISTISFLVTYPILVIVELLDRSISISSISFLFILIPNILLTLSLILFSISLFIQKKIYGKTTIFQGLMALILALSFFIPPLLMFQLPFFILFFVSLTYLVNKKLKDKKEFKGVLI